MGRDLESLHLTLQIKVGKLIQLGSDIGIKVIIIATKRTLEEQARHYAVGRYIDGDILTYKKAGESLHNYGLAFDISCHRDGISQSVNDFEMYKTMGRLGKELGLFWGGDTSRYCDVNHYSWTGGRCIRDLEWDITRQREVCRGREYVRRCTDMYVHVRRKANLTNPSIGIIAENTPIRIFNIDGIWAEIEFLGHRAYIPTYSLKDR